MKAKYLSARPGTSDLFLMGKKKVELLHDGQRNVPVKRRLASTDLNFPKLTYRINS